MNTLHRPSSVPEQPSLAATAVKYCRAALVAALLPALAACVTEREVRRPHPVFVTPTGKTAFGEVRCADEEERDEFHIYYTPDDEAWVVPVDGECASRTALRGFTACEQRDRARQLLKNDPYPCRF